MFPFFLFLHSEKMHNLTVIETIFYFIFEVQLVLYFLLLSSYQYYSDLDLFCLFFKKQQNIIQRCISTNEKVSVNIDKYIKYAYASMQKIKCTFIPSSIIIFLGFFFISTMQQFYLLKYAELSLYLQALQISIFSLTNYLALNLMIREQSSNRNYLLAVIRLSYLVILI